MSAEIEAVARVVVDAAYTIHRTLGPGFVEAVYANALAVELGHRGVAFESEVEVPIYYRQTLVGQHRLDMLVEQRLVVEIKAVQTAHPPHHLAQVISYLRATERELGLLLNFGLPTMREGTKRVIQSRVLPD